MSNSFLAADKASHDSLKVTLVEGGDLGKVRDWDMAPNAYSNRVVSLTNSSQDFLNGGSCSIIAYKIGDSL
jgi:ubiquinone biosynthesis monooxygenase Coq6